MNSIPLIFNEHQIQRVIIGGKTGSVNPKFDISVILLNETGPQFHTVLLENLISCGFKSIISVEPNNENCNIENISKKFKYIVLIIQINSLI